MKTSDLSSVPRATHELWQDLKVSLQSNRMVSHGCTKSINPKAEANSPILADTAGSSNRTREESR